MTKTEIHDFFGLRSIEIPENAHLLIWDFCRIARCSHEQLVEALTDVAEMETERISDLGFTVSLKPKSKVVLTSNWNCGEFECPAITSQVIKGLFYLMKATIYRITRT